MRTLTAFRPTAGGGAREPVTGISVLGLVFRPQDRPSIRAHKLGTSAHPRTKRSVSRSRGRVRTARASARRRAVGLNGSSAHRSQSRSTRANDQRGSDPERPKELPSRNAMSSTAPPGGPPRNTRCPSRTRTTRATAPAIGAPPIPRERSRQPRGWKTDGGKNRTLLDQSVVILGDSIPKCQPASVVLV